MWLHPAELTVTFVRTSEALTPEVSRPSARAFPDGRGEAVGKEEGNRVGARLTGHA